MRRHWQKVRIGVAVVAAVLALDGAALGAPVETLRGRWNVQMRTSIGAISAEAHFKSGGEGAFELGSRSPLVYRESGTRFSFSVEVPGSATLSGQPMTLVAKGERDGDTFSGDAILIMDDINPNQSGPVEYGATQVRISGSRIAR